MLCAAHSPHMSSSVTDCGHCIDCCSLFSHLPDRASRCLAHDLTYSGASVNAGQYFYHYQILLCGSL